MNRRAFLTSLAATMILPVAASGQEMPSSGTIMQRLDVEPRRRIRSEERVTIRELKRRQDLRRSAPSIDIQSINFAFGSAEIPRSEYRKVREIGRALEQLTRRRRGAIFLIEGHTDAVGTEYANQVLSERRAEALKWLLVREFGIPARALETEGYGEQFLLIDTQREEWRNRRVTLRRIDQFLR